MKIRIKGNSIRMRLTKSEVTKLENTGYLEEKTQFADNKLTYALERINEGESLTANFQENKITMFVPKKLVDGWAENNVIGFNSSMPVANLDSIYLLVEKDFICLDESTEDQSDNYENPHKTC